MARAMSAVAPRGGYRRPLAPRPELKATPRCLLSLSRPYSEFSSICPRKTVYNTLY